MADNNDDEVLIAAALNGSALAWEKLVKCYESKVYNYGLRLTGNATDAMDLMQEVFIGVYNNLHRFRGESKFTSWLFRIAHNKAVDMNRKKRLLYASARVGDDEGDEWDRSPGPKSQEPELKLGVSQQNLEMKKLLMQLSMDQRLVIELKIYQSYTFEGIAEVQGISVNTAKTRYYSALKKLKTGLEIADAMP